MEGKIFIEVHASNIEFFCFKTFSSLMWISKQDERRRKKFAALRKFEK